MMLSKQGPIRRTHPQLHMTVAVDRTVAVIPARTSEPAASLLVVLDGILIHAYAVIVVPWQPHTTTQ